MDYTILNMIACQQTTRHSLRPLRYATRMTHLPERKRERAAAGLCAECLHSRRVESARSSIFFLCELSRTDQRFLKYPRLPVLSCDGFKKKP